MCQGMPQQFSSQGFNQGFNPQTFGPRMSHQSFGQPMGRVMQGMPMQDKAMQTQQPAPAPFRKIGGPARSGNTLMNPDGTMGGVYQPPVPQNKGLVLSEGPKAGFGGGNPDFSPLPPDGRPMPPTTPAYLYGTTAGMFGAPQSPDPRMMYNLGAKTWGMVPGYNGVR